MNTRTTLTQVLLEEAEATYSITERLFRRVADRELLWKPATGGPWMTVGQLLMHCASFGCGKAIQGFVTGDWGLPERTSLENLDATQHVPPPAALPTVQSVKQALELLACDRSLAYRRISEVDESEFLGRRLSAPWGGPENTLFQHLLLMIAHLGQHKGQLFYYLKLMGKELNTGDLWGS